MRQRQNSLNRRGHIGFVAAAQPYPLPPPKDGNFLALGLEGFSVYAVLPQQFGSLLIGPVTVEQASRGTAAQFDRLLSLLNLDQTASIEERIERD